MMVIGIYVNCDMICGANIWASLIGAPSRGAHLNDIASPREWQYMRSIQPVYNIVSVQHHQAFLPIALYRALSAYQHPGGV